VIIGEPGRILLPPREEWVVPMFIMRGRDPRILSEAAKRIAGSSPAMMTTEQYP